MLVANHVHHDSHGVQALVAALKTRTAFDYLRLCQNSIGDVGLQAKPGRLHDFYQTWSLSLNCHNTGLYTTVQIRLRVRLYTSTFWKW